jgi:hypothetical protein
MTDGVNGGVAHLAMARCAHREGIRSHLGDLRIGTDVHYPTLDFNQPSQRGLPTRRLDLRVSEVAVNEIVCLPCFPGMTDPEVQRVVGALESFAEAAAVLSFGEQDVAIGPQTLSGTVRRSESSAELDRPFSSEGT